MHDSIAVTSSPVLVVPARGGSAGMDRIPWRWADVAVGIAVLIPLLYLSRYYSEWFVWLPDGIRFTLLAAVPVAWMTLYPQALARRRGYPIRSTFLRPRGISREVLVALPIGLASTVALMGAAYVYHRLTGQSLGSSGGLSEIPPGQLLSFLLMSFTLIPIAEEVFFRGFVYNALRQKWGRGAIVGQAVLFAVVHPYSLPQKMVVFTTGLMFGAVYCWRKSLVAGIVIHAIHNLVTSVLIVALISASAKAAYLGIEGKVRTKGHVISRVVPQSPAAQADLRSGDVIVRIDRSRIKPGNDLGRILRSKRSGQLLELEVLRDQQPIIVLVQATSRP